MMMTSPTRLPGTPATNVPHDRPARNVSAEHGGLAGILRDHAAAVEQRCEALRKQLAAAEDFAATLHQHLERHTQQVG
jgi:hypothetical protein